MEAEDAQEPDRKGQDSTAAEAPAGSAEAGSSVAALEHSSPHLNEQGVLTAETQGTTMEEEPNSPGQVTESVDACVSNNAPIAEGSANSDAAATTVDQRPTQQPHVNGAGNVTEEDVYDALLAAALDADVSDSAGIALGVLGGRAEGKLVERAAEMIALHTKALSDAAIRGSMCHRAALYRVVRSVLSTSPAAPDGPARSQVGQEVAEHLAGLAVTDVLLEPTGNDNGKEVRELREAAGAVLSQLAGTHMGPVLTKLLPRLEVATMFEQQQAQRQKLLGRRVGGAGPGEGRQQHFVRVLEALQMVATERKEALGGHFKRVLSAMLPVMGVAVASQTRQAWAVAMRSACEAAQYTWQEAAAGLTDREKLDAGGRVGMERDGALEYAVQAAYDVVASTWTTSKDAQVQQSAFLALAAMTCLMPSEQLDERVSGSIVRLCQLLQGLNIGATPRERGQGTGGLLQQAGALTNSLRSVAEAATAHGQALSQHAGEVMAAVLPVACCPPEYSERGLQGAFADALALLETVCRQDATAVTELLLTGIHPERRSRRQLVAEPARLHWGCLAVLNHIVRRVPGCVSDRGAEVMQSLVALAGSADPLVRMQVADLVMAIAPQGVLGREGGQALLLFLVASAAGAGGEGAPAGRQGFFGRRERAEPGGRQWWWPRGAAREAPKAQLQRVAVNALHLLAGSVEPLEPLLWPTMLSFLAEPSLGAAQSAICRGVAVVVKRMKEQGKPVAVDYQVHSTLLSAPALIARFAALLAPMLFSGIQTFGLFPPLFASSGTGNATVNVIEALSALAELYPQPIAALWAEKLPELLEAMPASGASGAEAAGREQWMEGVQELFAATLSKGPGLAFNLAVGDALMEQRGIYDGDEEQRAGVSMLLGEVFGSVEEATYVRVGLHEVFWEANHLSGVERRACSQCFRRAAGRHFVAAVEVLEEIFKKDAPPPPPPSSSSSSSSSLASITAGFLAVSQRVRRALEPDSEPQVATALLACGQVVREGSTELLQQHLHAILALALPCLPGGAKFHFLRGAKIHFIELVGQSVTANAAHLHAHLLMDHVDKVLQAVPQLLYFARDPVTKGAVEAQHADAIARVLEACASLASLRPGFTRRAFVPLVAAVAPMLELLPEVREDNGATRSIYQLVCLAVKPLERAFTSSADGDRLHACALACALLHALALEVAALRRRPRAAAGTPAITAPPPSATSGLGATVQPPAWTEGSEGAGGTRGEERGGGGEVTEEHVAHCLALLLPRIADASSRVAQVAATAVKAVSVLAAMASVDAAPAEELEPFPDVEWVMGEAGAPEEVWDWCGSGVAPAMLRGASAGAEEGEGGAGKGEEGAGLSMVKSTGGGGGAEKRGWGAGAGVGGGDQTELAQGRVREVVREVVEKGVLGGDGVVLCVERMLMEVRNDTHLKGSEGAATAVAELLRLQGGALSPAQVGAMARKALAVGSQAAEGSKQHAAAVSTVVHCTRFHFRQVVGEFVATEEELEQYLPHPQAQAVRTFSGACIAAIVVDRTLGSALVKSLAEILVESEITAAGREGSAVTPTPAAGGLARQGYTSLKDMGGQEKASWREELGFLLRPREHGGEKGNEPWDPARAGRDLPLVSLAQEAQRGMTLQAGMPLPPSGGEAARRSGARARHWQKKYAAKVLGDLLQEAGARVALEVNRQLLAVVLAVRVGTVAIERSLDDDNPAALGARGGLIAELLDDGGAWPEIKATLQHFTARCKLAAVDAAIQRQELWAGLRSPDLLLDALLALSLALFSALLPAAGPELAHHLLRLLGPRSHASQRASAAVCFAALVTAAGGHEELVATVAEQAVALSRDEGLPSHVRRHLLASLASLFSSSAVMLRAGPDLAAALLDAAASDLRVLQYPAGEVLPSCLCALPPPAAEEAAPRVRVAIGQWLRAADPVLRAHAAALAGALHAFVATGRDGGHGGKSESETAANPGGTASELGGMAGELLPFLLLALADSAHGVRIAAKRAIRQLGLALYRGCEPIRELLQSSALDERWQTDLPLLLSSLLQLFHQHAPDDVQRYLAIVTSSPHNERVEMVAGIATLGGAFLRSALFVDKVARQLLLLLEYPDLQVRCSAAQALQHFTPAKGDPPA